MESDSHDNEFEKIDRHGQTEQEEEFSQASSAATETYSQQQQQQQQQQEKEKEKAAMESKVISKAAENMKSNIEKTVKQGIDKVSKAIQKQNPNELQNKLNSLWLSFIAPSKTAKKDVSIAFLPPFLVEILIWNRPKVTLVIATMSFLLYGLVAFNEYTVLGLLSTIAYMLLFVVIVLHNLKPFVSSSSSSTTNTTTKNVEIVSKEKLEKYAKELVDSSVLVSNSFASIINCDDFVNTLSALFSIYCFSIVANNISGMFLVFLFLVVSFSLPYVYVMRKKDFDEITKKMKNIVHNSINKLYDAIPKADMKQQ